MRRVLCLAGACAVLLGCGGGGNRFPSQFEGSYSGTVYVDGDAGESMQLTISRNGAITGSESVGSATAADTGSVDDNGRFNITSRLAGTPDLFYSGSMGFDVNNRLVGSGTARQSGDSTNFSFTLRQTGF